MKMIDVVIIGAGPAGLSAALWLGRCRRRTLVFDSQQPRNAASPALHGFLTRDGMPPMALRNAGRAELAKYPSVTIRDVGVRSARRKGRYFTVQAADGTAVRSRLLLLATGRVDTVPDAPGLRRFYGRGVYHCPYCDGWEHRDEAVVILGHGRAARDLGRILTTWTSDIAVCTDGRKASRTLRDAGWPVHTAKLADSIQDRHRRFAGLLLDNGATLACRALFFSSDCSQKSSLPERLGCRFDRGGSVRCRAHAATDVPGLFVAGNVRGGVHLAIMAAAEGAEAALAMNEWLVDRDRPGQLRRQEQRRAPPAGSRRSKSTR